jgi:O-acetyl-ADP-ribose deacetylase
MGRMETRLGDITKVEADAVVNAANTTLLGGGGVDGAIHRAAGPGLLEECRKLGGCPTGEARLTGGYNLPAKHVIHTPGPVWQGGRSGEAELLRSCYRSCLDLVRKHGLRSVAFPSISTGVYHYPFEAAAGSAVAAARDFLEANPGIEKIIFVCFRQPDLEVYERLLAKEGPIEIRRV